MRKIERPHRNDPTKNATTGGAVREVIMRAIHAGCDHEGVDRAVGAFVHTFAGCAWDAAIEQALQPHRN